MDKNEFNASLEAILFAAGHPVEYEKIAGALMMTNESVKDAASEAAKAYDGRGIELVIYDNSCQLCTKAAHEPEIKAALSLRRAGTLSNSSMEALAIIAYRQPCTRVYVDTVRGIDSGYAINTLVGRGLIEAGGRLDAPGRPILYVTTAEFLRCFGFSSLADMPVMPELPESEVMVKND